MSDLQFDYIHSKTELKADEARLFAMFELHRQLRPVMSDFADYCALLDTLLDEQQHFVLAHRGTLPLAGLAMFHIHHNTYQGKLLFLEDLVVDETLRGTAVGGALIDEIEHHAREQNCQHMSLDSGVHRGRAHKFYFAHGYTAESFHFCKKL